MSATAAIQLVKIGGLRIWSFQDARLDHQLDAAIAAARLSRIRVELIEIELVSGTPRIVLRNPTEQLPVGELVWDASYEEDVSPWFQFAINGCHVQWRAQ